MTATLTVPSASAVGTAARPRNIIVTCGTSQIDPTRVQSNVGRKLTLLNNINKSDRFCLFGCSSPEEFSRRCAMVGDDLNQLFQSMSAWLDRNWPRDKMSQPVFSRLWEMLQHSDKNCPFGAELSTLFLMERGSEFVPERDRVTVLASETPAGVFAALLVCHFLEQHRGLTPFEMALGAERHTAVRQSTAKLRLLLVGGLDASGWKYEAADAEVYRCLEASLEPDVDQFDHSIVYSGGYKVTIPIMVAFSLAKNCKLYYRHETHDRARKTFFPKTLHEIAATYLATHPDSQVVKTETVAIDVGGQ